MEGVPRPRLPLTVTAALASLALVACSGPADSPSGSPATTASGSAPSTTTTTAPTTPSPSIDGAPDTLTSAVVRRYGGAAVEGEAELGRWRGDQVAVVTGTGEQEGDVTLAVRGKDAASWKVVGGWWPSLGEKGRPDLGGRQHVLLVGSDARPGESRVRSRADALQLVGTDGEGGAGIMGFARDLWVPIPGRGQGKLNSAMVYGGPKGQVSTIRSLTGIEPQGYVVTDFRGMRDAVNEAGGLTITLPKALSSHMRGGQLPAGKQKINGSSAVILSRERQSLAGGDFERSANQSLVVAAIALQAKLEGPSGLPRLVTILSKHSSSDLTASQMMRFSASFYRVDPAKVGRAVAKGTLGSAGGQSVVFLDDASRRAFQDFRDGRIG